MDQVKNIVQQLPQMKREQKYVSIFAAATLLYTTYKLISSSRKSIEGAREIPMPDGWYPIFGHMLSLGKLPGAKIKEWHRKYGPIIRIKMGKQTWILLDDPQLAHKVFVSNGVETSYRPYGTYTHKYYSNEKGIAFANPGGVWQQGRSAALSVLAPKQIQKYGSFIENEASKLADNLINATEESKEGISPLKYLELCAINFIFNVSFGRTFSSIDDPEFKKITHVVETSMDMAGAANDLASFVPMLAIVDFLHGSQKKMEKFSYEELNPTFEQLVNDAKAKDTPNLVKSFQRDYKVDGEELRVIMSDLIGGGTDTTTVTMLWNFALMCHYPEVQQAAANEIGNFVKEHGRLPNFDDREHTPYCVSVMKESMRFKPTSPFGVPHSVKKTTVIEGYIFPKDCAILTSMESIHSNPACYSDPDTFDPNRFMTNQKTMQAAANGRLEERDHYNFGWGRRICPGIYLAEVEIFNVFVQVLGRCKIEPAGELPNIDEAKNAGLTLNPMPYKVKFTKRVNV